MRTLESRDVTPEIKTAMSSVTHQYRFSLHNLWAPTKKNREPPAMPLYWHLWKTNLQMGNRKSNMHFAEDRDMVKRRTWHKNNCKSENSFRRIVKRGGIKSVMLGCFLKYLMEFVISYLRNLLESGYWISRSCFAGNIFKKFRISHRDTQAYIELHKHKGKL